MDATKPVTPQINFNPASPLEQAAQQQPAKPADQPQQDTSLPAPVNGGASIGARTGFDAAAFKQKLSTGAQQAMAAGMPPLSALVVGAIGAHGPDQTGVTAANDPTGPQMTGPNPQSPGQKTAGKVLSGINQIGAGLGDAGAVGTVPHGGGALTGISRTLGARDQRMRQQGLDQQEANKNAAMTAEANTRMIHEQRLIHNLDEDAKDTAVKNGSMQLDTLLRQPAPSTVIAKDLTADQIGQYMQNQGQDQKFDPSKETAIATGFKNTGTDPKTGLPMRQITYSLVSLPQDVKLNPNDEKQKANLDMLNEYAPPTNGGKWGDGDHQNMTGQQYNLLTQQAHDRVAQNLALEKASADAGFQLNEIKKGKEAIAFQNDPAVNNALANASSTGNVIAARNALMQANNNPNSPLFGKYNNIDNDLRERMGYVEGKEGKKDYVYDKMIEDYQKRLDAGIEQVTTLQHEVDTAHGANAADMVGKLQARLDDPNTDPNLIPKLKTMLNQAQAGSANYQKYEVEMEQKKKKMEQDVQDGNVAGLADSVMDYTMPPEKMASLRNNQRAALMQEVQARNAELPPDQRWSEAKYKARVKTTQDYSPEGKGGQNVRSLNVFAGHLGEANDLIQGLHNTNSKWVNMPLNKLKDSWGNEAISTYKTALEAAKKEYENFLNNQHAQHEIDKQAMEKLVSEDTPPSVAQGILRQMTKTVAIRAHVMNDEYAGTMGKDIPNLMNDDSKQVLNTFGIDPNSLLKRTGQGTSGLVGNDYAPQVPSNIPKDSKWVVGPNGKGYWMNQQQAQEATKNGGRILPQRPQ